MATAKLSGTRIVSSKANTRNPCGPVRAGAAQAPPQTSLKYNKYGESDLLVSEICMGCMMFGSQNTEKEAVEILDHAWDCGVNFLDTSEVYPIMPKAETQGRSSTYVGNWMQNQKREDVIVATKVAGRSENITWVPGNRLQDDGGVTEGGTVVDGKSIIEACEGELRRLQTDFLDLFQIHWTDRYVPQFGRTQYLVEKEYEYNSFEEQVQAMGDLIKAGKIRHWGLSNETSFGTMKMCQAADDLGVPRPVSIQNSYSLIGRQFESELAEVCSPSNYNIPLLPWSAAAGGVLSGKYVDGKRPEGSRFASLEDRYGRFVSGKAEMATKEYVKIASEAGVTPTQLAYLFCKSKWFIPSTIIGATNLDQLKENIEGFGKDLSEEILAKIDEVHLQYTNPQNLD